MPPPDMKMQTRIESENGSLIEHTTSVPVAETYFSIPQDLGSLEDINVLDYLRKHVWLSSQRQKKCKDVFFQLTKFNSCECQNELNIVECGNNSVYDIDQTGGVNLPMVFLGVALVDLFEFPATHYNMTELYKFLEYDKLRFREMDFRTWCGVSAFAERMVCEGPLQCESLERADFKYLRTYGDWWDFSKALQSVFDVIQRAHSNVFCYKFEDKLD